MNATTSCWGGIGESRDELPMLGKAARVGCAIGREACRVQERVVRGASSRRNRVEQETACAREAQPHRGMIQGSGTLRTMHMRLFVKKRSRQAEKKRTECCSEEALRMHAVN